MTEERHLVMFLPYYPPSLGGIANHSQEFAHAMADAGYALTLFVPRFQETVFQEDHPHVRLVYYPAAEIIPNYPVPAFWLPEFWRALRSLGERRIDCVFSRTRFFLTSVLAFFYAKIRHLKWIHIEHGSAYVKVSNPVVAAVARLFDETCGRLVLTSSDEVVSISEDVQAFVKKFRRKPTPLIYRGLDLPAYDKIPPEAALVQEYPGKVLVAWAGRMYRWKGVLDIIAAVGMLPADPRNRIQLILIGDGEDRERVVAASRGLPVTCMPSMSRDAVLAHLKSTDIFVHASYPGGGLSTSLLEAMYCRNAVVATPFEGATFVVRDDATGLLLSGNSARGIADALTKLVEDERLRKRLAENAHASVVKEFSWTRVAAQYSDVITRVLTG